MSGQVAVLQQTAAKFRQIMYWIKM